jgi:cytochrome P450
MTVTGSDRQFAPGPVKRQGFLSARARALLVVVPGFMRDPIAYLSEAARQYGGIVTLSPDRIHFVAHPDHVKHVLQDHHVNYRKGPHYDALRPVLGNGLLVSDGAFWRRQRRLAQPAFHRQRISGLVEGMIDEIAGTLKDWAGFARQGTSLDIRAAMNPLVLKLLLKLQFGGGIQGEMTRLLQALVLLQDGIKLERAVKPLNLLGSIPTPRNIRFRRETVYFHGFVQRMIDERRRQEANTRDLLSMLVFARDEETGEAMDDAQLRDEVLTFVHAGTDAVSTAIVWTLYLVAQHPLVRKRLEDEVDAVLGGRRPAFEDIAALSYSQMVIQESMRLYPPVWVIGRQAIEDDKIGGFHIPAGSMITLCPYVTHRLECFWESPDTFDPERFAPARSHDRHRFAYFPFGGGPRMCIGASLGMSEITLILAMVTQLFRLNLVPGQRIGSTPRITLRPDRPVWMTIQPRTHE